MGVVQDRNRRKYTNSSSSMDNTEQSLIEACLANERWAQKQLYESHYPKMMGICMRYAKDNNEAKDIANEGFIKVFRYLHKYKVGTSLESWIRRIIVNTCIDQYRKSVRHRTEDIEHIKYHKSCSPDPISNFSAQEIMAVIQQLPTSYRTVFNLFAIEGYSHKEVAKQLGITESTSRSNLVKARSKLKKMLTHLRLH